jgi:hypothetical protein
MPHHPHTHVHAHAHAHDARAGEEQHPSAYVSIRQHASAYVSIRQHTSAYVSVRGNQLIHVCSISTHTHTHTHAHTRTHTHCDVVRPLPEARVKLRWHDSYYYVTSYYNTCVLILLGDMTHTFVKKKAVLFRPLPEPTSVWGLKLLVYEA